MVFPSSTSIVPEIGRLNCAISKLTVTGGPVLTLEVLVEDELLNVDKLVVLIEFVVEPLLEEEDEVEFVDMVEFELLEKEDEEVESVDVDELKLLVEVLVVVV